ncbi:MAG: S8 family serine peptidase [Gemmatimonadota bacterium]|nr:S8 family serine peptidase [Gemmatimonadota bacterium]
MRKPALLLLSLLTLVAVSCADDAAPPTDATDRGAVAPASVDEPYAPGRVLALFRPGAPAASIARANGATIQREVALGIQMLGVAVGREVAVSRALERNPNVIFAEPDFVRLFGDLTMPGDPFFGYKWDLHNDGTINDSQGNELATTGQVDADVDWLEAFDQLGAYAGGATLGIMDTGIRETHEDLAGRVVAQYDFHDDDPDASDDHGHGTHVAGIATAYAGNGKGVAGVAYGADVTLAIAKVCGPIHPPLFGQDYGCYTSSTAAGIEWAVDNGAHVLNLSLGGSNASDTEQTALQYARSNNVLPVCAAGNDAGAVSYPAAFPECVAVSATDWGDGLASYSNFGPEVELSAPGGDDEHPDGYSYIASSYYDADDSYVLMAGTSMASPQVAGLATLLHELGYSDDGAKLTQMKATVDDLGASGWDEKFGEGRINVFRAIGGTPSDGGTTNSAPTASFTYTCTDLTCDFDGTGSSDSDGSIASYDWDFGDGNTGSGSTVTHTYAAGGTYTVTLTVTDDDGATDTSSQDVTVSESTTNSPPTASFTYGCTDLACDFDGTGSSDSDGSIASYDWDFGDGNTGTGSTVSHTYGADGTYTVTLTVTDDDGATDSSSQDVTVSASTSGISLSATGYKVRGRHHADLSWSGATSTNVDVYRDGAVIAMTENDGFYTDSTNNVGGGSYTYQVCEAGTSTCSNEATVTF